MLKFDAGDPVSFKAINQPVEGIEFSSLLKGLEAIPHLVLQCVLFSGEVTNTRGEAYQNWKHALSIPRPKKVHIYSTERPTTSQGVECLPPEKLSQIRDDLQKELGLVVEAFWR
jgi:wyosine [tRNA(Phe)-imidazoG37] synthetase (radical SAM superfamily)